MNDVKIIRNKTHTSITLDYEKRIGLFRLVSCILVRSLVFVLPLRFTLLRIGARALRRSLSGPAAVRIRERRGRPQAE